MITPLGRPRGLVGRNTLALTFISTVVGRYRSGSSRQIQQPVSIWTFGEECRVKWVKRVKYTWFNCLTLSLAVVGGTVREEGTLSI